MFVKSKLCFSSSHVWMWELGHKEGWAPKNWCFQIMVLEKTLESSLDCKEIKWVKEINPKYSLEWLKLKFQHFGHMMQRVNSLEDWCSERLKQKKGMVGNEMVSITDSMDVNLSKLLETGENRGAWLSTVQRLPKSWTWLNDWTTTKFMINQVKREMANWKWNLQHLQQSVSISNAHVVFLKYKELQTDGKI